jgi:ubiquinone/menaquinone biosynthesis C-methylase UbiE
VPPVMSAKTVTELLGTSEGIIDLLPPSMAEVTRQDAEYHGEAREEWIELNQIETERNERFHAAALAEIAQGLTDESVVLELGAGVGYDAQRFLDLGAPFGCYLLSEITPRLLEYARSRLAGAHAADKVLYCCMDASNMRIADGQVDRVLAIATAHHFPDLDQTLTEIDRVTRPGARIVFAMEPNRLWSALLVALRPVYRRLFSSKSHSAADEDAEGFRMQDFAAIAQKRNWTLRALRPAWLLAGFLHMGLELLYRLLRLKRRIKLPRPLERLILATDRALFAIPGMSRLAWHYSVVFEKP